MVIHGISAGLEITLAEKNRRGSGVKHEPAMCSRSKGLSVGTMRTSSIFFPP